MQWALTIETNSGRGERAQTRIFESEEAAKAALLKYAIDGGAEEMYSATGADGEGVAIEDWDLDAMVAEWLEDERETATISEVWE